MKKIALLLVSLVLVASFAFAMQEAFNVSSPEYQQTISLCRVAGIETQLMVSPVSADQLLTFLHKIDISKLSSTEQAVYFKLVNHLEHPYMVYGVADNGFDAIITTCPDLFFHTSKEEIVVSESVEPKRNLLPLFEVGGKVYLSDCFFGNFYYQNVEKDTVRQKPVAFNMGSVYDIDLTSPYQALVSAGKNGFNFMIGRDQLSLGSGKTGNLLLGDNFWYEDFAKLSYLRGMFSYDMTLITFDLNYENYKHNSLNFEPFDFNSAHDMVVIHQFSFRPFKWFNLSASEGMLQYGNNLFGDLSILNPFMLLHNVNSYYMGTANNFFSLDFAFAPAKSWHINATLFFDQIQQPQELQDGQPYDDTAPNAYAFMLNTTYSKALLNGIADFYVEGVYTNPAVYLKEKHSGYDTYKEYNYWDVDLIVGNSTMDAELGDIGYLGYKYGPDTIAIGTGFDYSEIDKLQVSFDALFRIHGAKGINLTGLQQDYNDVGPDYFKLKTPTYTEGINAPEYRLSLIASGKYQPTNWLTVQAETGYIRAWNYHNEIGKDFGDLQFAIGFKLNPVHLGANLIKKHIY